EAVAEDVRQRRVPDDLDHSPGPGHAADTFGRERYRNLVAAIAIEVPAGHGAAEPVAEFVCAPQVGLAECDALGREHMDAPCLGVLTWRPPDLVVHAPVAVEIGHQHRGSEPIKGFGKLRWGWLLLQRVTDGLARSVPGNRVTIDAAMTRDPAGADAGRTNQERALQSRGTPLSARQRRAKEELRGAIRLVEDGRKHRDTLLG